jgi:pimeloyl-ACP methyl ester carboxylesterase
MFELSVPGGRIVGDVSGSGAPLLLLHSGVTDRRMWNAIMPDLERQFTVARFDYRGFGESSVATEPFVYRDDVLSVLDHLAFDRVALVGASMGGFIALQVSLAAPDRVESAILLAPGLPGRQHTTEILEYFAAEEAAVAAKDIDAIVRLDLEMWVRGPRRDWSAQSLAVAEELRDQVRILATNQTIAEDYGQLGEPPIQDHLHSVAVPTVVAIAEADPISIIGAGEYIAAQVPGAQILRFADTAHLIAMERPAETVELITDTLAKR